MKKTIVALFPMALLGFAAIAQTPDETESKTFGGIELTFGGAGTDIDGESEFGFDFSLSTNPFEARPEVWVGIVQGFYWEPSFAGSTDLFVDWSHNLWKETLFANVGWSVGSVYDTSDHYWRTGPELTLQYCVADNAFIYSGVNYDFVTKGENGFRYSFGIGLSF